MDTLPKDLHNAYREYVLRLGDTELIMGHRMSEWCGHGPVLEEDIALANMSLDCIGHAKFLLEEVGGLDSPVKSADELAYFRGVREFRTALMAELPRGDFAFTILRQYFCSLFFAEVYAELASCGSA
ncbi:MAG: phenylacetate-CoA oxygenase subunit PaaI, partial [Bdellovibrionales bacterium]|nr:phenylacetate-CoA oxygenase subunit PaaI [Bdellovibrionales bacterium]